MNNPFDTLDTRLISLESKLDRLLDMQAADTAGPNVGGMDIAQEVTGLSKARIYNLVTEKDPAKRLPHKKRGNRLFFDRAELLGWIAEGQRGENVTAANA